MNKAKLLLAGLSFTALIFTACNKNKKNESFSIREKTPTHIEEANISLGFSTNMEDPRAIASLLFKDEVERDTNGRIKISIFSDGTLGSDTELIEGLMKNSVDMTVSSAGNFAVYATKVGVSALPFLFSTFEDAWTFMDSDLISQVNKTLEDYGIVVLSHYDNGFRCVTTTNKPINQVYDMKGLNIRTPPNQIVMETMLALGANPKPYAFNELKKALKDGIFDSQENPIPVIYNSRLYEEQKYLAITNHSYDAMPLAIRKELWESFSPEDQKILLQAAKKAQDLNRKLVQEQTQSYVAKLKDEGMTITSPNLAEFKSATSPVKTVFSEIYGQELLDKLPQ